MAIMVLFQKLLFTFFLCSSILLLFGIEAVESSSHHHHHHPHHHENVKKLFVFGDSYADTGNNRSPLGPAWKEPYGVTFPGKPSGRFSDGRVFTDYLARHLGLRSPTAYAFRKYKPNHNLKYGMNFAFGGTGVFDTNAPYPNMTTQIDFFEQLLHDAVFTPHDLQNSIAHVSLVGNDYSTYLARGGSIAKWEDTELADAATLRQAFLKPSQFPTKWLNLQMLDPLGDTYPAHLPSLPDLKGLNKVLMIYLLWRMEKMQLSDSPYVIPEELAFLLDPPACLPQMIQVSYLHLLRVNLVTSSWTNMMQVFETKWVEREIEVEVAMKFGEVEELGNQISLSLEPKTFKWLQIRRSEGFNQGLVPNLPKPFRMKILYWNARGIARPKFLANMETMLQQHIVHMLIVSETKVGGSNAEPIINKLPFDKSIVVDSVGLSGGLMILWNSDFVTFEATKVNRQGIHGIVKGFQTFIPQVVNQLAINVERLYKLGVKKISVTALQPLGCLPLSTGEDNSSFQQCNDTYNQAVAFHNVLLQQAISKFNNQTSIDNNGSQPIVVVDLYTAFFSIFQQHIENTQQGKSRFDNIMEPCCKGINQNYTCGGVDEQGNKMYKVCQNPKSYFFWDQVHPTQAGWEALTVALQPNLEEIRR